jgi:predicted DNA-binding transcriptional regulator AlpA
MENTPSRGLKDTEAAEMLGLHPQTLRNMRSRGKGPNYHKLGRAVRYLERDLLAYLEKRKIQTDG